MAAKAVLVNIPLSQCRISLHWGLAFLPNFPGPLPPQTLWQHSNSRSRFCISISKLGQNISPQIPELKNEQLDKMQYQQFSRQIIEGEHSYIGASQGQYWFYKPRMYFCNIKFRPVIFQKTCNELFADHQHNNDHTLHPGNEHGNVRL